MQSPIYQLVSVLEGVISGLVFTLDELKEQREKNAAAVAPDAPEEKSKESNVVAAPEPGPVEEKKPDA